jgi:hypothetical protein
MMYVSVPVKGKGVRMKLEDARELYEALRKMFDKEYAATVKKSFTVRTCK